MNTPMTLGELIAELTKMKKNQHIAKWPVMLQVVKEGMTFGRPFRVSQGDPADGSVIWVYPVDGKQ